MRFNWFIIVSTFFISCKQENSKFELAKRIYSKIEAEGTEKLLNVEFAARGDIELWTYYLNSDYDSVFVWIYNSKKYQFDLSTHPAYEKFRKQVNDPLAFVKDLEDEKNRLGIKGISNSPWPGHFVKFWFTSSDALMYQPDGFKIDSESKQRWLDEFDQGMRIDQNWVYLDLNKNPQQK